MTGSVMSANELEGSWMSDPNDAETQREFGRVTQIFRPDGRLTYITHSQTKDQVMLLTYRVDGNEIVTDQPSSPGEFRTRFHFDTDGTLVLEDGIQTFRFVRKR
jgi:hypothetical protein